MAGFFLDRNTQEIKNERFIIWSRQNTVQIFISVLDFVVFDWLGDEYFSLVVCAAYAAIVILVFSSLLSALVSSWR